MSHVETVHELDAERTAAVVSLVERVWQSAGHRPLSDQQWLDLTRGGRNDVAAVLATGADDRLVGYAAVAPGNGSWTIEVVVSPDESRTEIADELVAAAVRHVAGRGGGDVHWWVFEPDGALAEVASHHGLLPKRTLHQMRAPLPLATPTVAPAEVRAFRIGVDEADWLEVNNAAFADHPEQGGWTIETVRQREQEPWFEPEGFLLHHRDGRLAAFCWTKIHRDEDPVLGEIYVIAVHPDFHALGLGKSMTVAGLASIAARGVTHGMLYVDRDNVAAYQLYVHLGFTVHRTDRAFVGHVSGDADLDGTSGGTR